VQAKTVQGILRHSRIHTTLDLYTQEDGDETRAARPVPQGPRHAIGSGAVKMWVRLWIEAFDRLLLKPLKEW
jgi:hypothetical protein